ncbi:MAG: T9SS type A sorting domain-containing protein [Saprospiraceae bacterium]|nr:T9SS type A sorting domain-containing protein [Saprospiraceae bacterium]MBK7736907.1 T9SS type A sorting domain-containing protein [Saprospiraceae bacterium]MBK7914499.1 T9SS type A sorting domain-containing protein [Saprospiraceae bacterium]
MNRILFVFLIGFLIPISDFAQELGKCGTGLHENISIRDRMFANRETFKDQIIQRSGAPYYIPVTYWMVAKADGSGRITIKNVIENLCAINKIYESLNMVFYLKAANSINNSFIYDDPSSTLGKAYINQYMLSNKNAVNIFVGNIANASSPGVLAFYTGDGDYIVCGKLHVGPNGTTLAHEIGHFFSLPHTFIGWEETDYLTVSNNCTTPPPISIFYRGNEVKTEYVDRAKPGTNGKLHCNQSADGFCDTPADYNLGFGFQGPGCVYTGCAKDPDNVKLDPNEANLMSYFLDCIKDFSEEQKAAITKDYLSTGRSYLKSPVYSPKPDVTDAVNYITPTGSIPPLGYDTVRFDWDDVPNADKYIFEIAENIGFNINNKLFLLSHSDTVLYNLKKNANHYWRVTPYNSNSFCVVSKISNFRTPSWTVANENIELSGLTVYFRQYEENKISLIIHSENNQSLQMQLFSTDGQGISNTNFKVQTGTNYFELDNLQAGIYFYRISDLTGKFNSGKFIKL